MLSNNCKCKVFINFLCYLELEDMQPNQCLDTRLQVKVHSHTPIVLHLDGKSAWDMISIMQLRPTSLDMQHN